MSNARIATVTSVSPYQVQFLGASAPLNLAPVVLGTVNVGDAVWCEFFDQQLVVLGRIEDGSVPQLGSTEDLNSFVYTGKWNQPLNANTSAPHNYPALSAGLLEVTRATSSGSMVHQRYTTYNSASGQVWSRTYYNGTWEPWMLVGASDSGVLTAAAAGFALGANFTGLSGQARKRNGLVTLTFAITTTNAISAGNISNVTVLTIPAGWEPSVAAMVSSGGTGDMWSGYASNSAVVMAATSTGFSAGSVFSGSSFWMTDQ